MKQSAVEDTGQASYDGEYMEVNIYDEVAFN